MKKILLLLTLTLMVGGAVRSQTELYKQMTKVEGITASCIENYPVGDDSVRVSVTILEASDTATYNKHVQMMKVMVEPQDKEFRDIMGRHILRMPILQKQEDNQSTLALLDRFPSLNTMTLAVFFGRMESEPSGFCLAYCVKEWRAIVVFHCRDKNELEQVVDYTYSLVLNSVKSLKTKLID